MKKRWSLAQLCARNRLPGFQCGSDMVFERLAGNDHLGVDKLLREGIEIDRAEGLTASLDTSGEVGFGQLVDAREVHERYGSGTKGLFAALNAFGARGDFGFPLARGLGEDVGVDGRADEASDDINGIGLAVERVEPQFRILFEVRTLGEKPLLEGDNEGGRLCLLCWC